MNRWKRKPRNVCTLEYITYDQRVALCGWMLNSPMTYMDMKARLKEEFGVETSESSLSSFYRKYVFQELIRRRAESVREAGMRTEEIAKNPADFQKPTMDALWEKAFLEARKPETPLRELKVYVELLARLKGRMLDERKVDLMERRLRMLEKKTAALEKESAKKPRLSDEQFFEKMRKVLKGETTKSNGHSPVEADRLNGFTS